MVVESATDVSISTVLALPVPKHFCHPVSSSLCVPGSKAHLFCCSGPPFLPLLIHDVRMEEACLLACQRAQRVDQGAFP